MARKVWTPPSRMPVAVLPRPPSEGSSSDARLPDTASSELWSGLVSSALARFAGTPVPCSRRPRGAWALSPSPGGLWEGGALAGFRANWCGHGHCSTLQPFSRKLWISRHLALKGFLGPEVRCLWGSPLGWASWDSGHWGCRMQRPADPASRREEGARVEGAFPSVCPCVLGELLQTPPTPLLKGVGTQPPHGRSTRSAHGSTQHVAAGAKLRLPETSAMP